MSVVLGIQRLVYIREVWDGINGVSLSIYDLYGMVVISVGSVFLSCVCTHAN